DRSPGERSARPSDARRGPRIVSSSNGDRRRARSSHARRVYAVEHTAVIEVHGLRVRPAAEDFVDRKELELGIAVAVARGALGVARPEVVPGHDVLPFGGVEEPEIGFGDRAREI